MISNSFLKENRLCVDGNRDVLTCVGYITYIGLDMFPATFPESKTAVDQVGGTARQMTYFLSSRAMWRQSLCSREKLSKSKVSADLERK